MNDSEPILAFGAPGDEPRWTPSTKEGIGTSYHTSCRLWFTISHGIVDEIYYPHVDQPNTRDLQFLITDGETFCHEERRDLDHEIEYPETDTLLYRLTNTDRAGRYRVIKEVATDPHSSVLLIHTRIEILDESLRGKLRVFALLAPHLRRGGMRNSGACCNFGGHAHFHVRREDDNRLHMAFGAIPEFTRRSVGYVGHSDGWQDLRNFKMDWEFKEAVDGNIALTGEVDLSQGMEFTLAVAFGSTQSSASAKLLQTLATPFANHRKQFVAQWKRADGGPDHAEHTGDDGSMFRLSRCVLLAHEDKTYAGAIVASMSIPWGEVRGDDELGGYHLVWPRDLVQTATGLIAAGRLNTARRALIWLACLQEEDGELPQNFWINGDAYWSNSQLDQVAAPILLAWRLKEAAALGNFDPWTMVSRAALYLITHGPVTRQDRWEECSGYSPATLATILAGMVCVAEFARQRQDDTTADFILSYADWLSAHIDSWTVTGRGELIPGKPRHYLRITPADPNNPQAHPDPDNATIHIANGGGDHPARNVVSLEFIHLVRLGLRSADHPAVVDTIEVIDRILKQDLPQGPCWLRYNHDGYGQHDDGSAFDGTGTGGAWPLLTGERGSYELAAGRDPRPYIETMERFANVGGMFAEQVWCGEDTKRFKKGEPTGSAMPLCWAHAEYITLVRGRAEGAPFDRIKPAYERYVATSTVSRHEIWTLKHRLPTIPPGKILRVIAPGEGLLLWSGPEGSHGESTVLKTAIGCFYADLPTEGLPSGAEIRFRIPASTGDDEYVVRIDG